jgi:hypothetical protein
MTRIPDAVNVASLDTHCLIVTVPNDGPADVESSLPRRAAADVLRQLADHLEATPCPTSLATGQPCPVHDAPTAPRTAPTRPRSLDDLLAHLADRMPDDHPADDEQPRPHPFGLDLEQAQRAGQQLGEAFAAFGRKLRAAVEEAAAKAQQAGTGTAESCENCGHAAHGHAEHLTNPEALTDCPHCPCAAELREMSGEEPATPAEGDQYIKRADPDEGRVVTVERVWTAPDGHTAVAYQWTDDKPGQSFSACPLDVFRRTYRPATAPVDQ